MVEALAGMLDHGRLFVFHSAVIAYLDVTGRELDAARMSRRPDPSRRPDGYVVGVDGQAVGHTHQHGRSLHRHG